MPWEDDPEGSEAWRKGLTGYPVVDAGMRELAATGWMHNRARLVTASFLTKHLLLDWRLGEEHFWDSLVDADPSQNAFNWQWVAGSGTDAAPYFRIFNPMLQGRRFDADGEYVRRWVPELRELPAQWIHSPWDAPAEELERAGVRLGKDYPMPIVDHAEARQRALEAYDVVKAAKGDA
jgi:deoxyribodipyrimidine photo-lyase